MQTPDEKVALITEVADKLYAATSTFEGNVGLQLAYLYPAIAEGKSVTWWDDNEKEIIELFRSVFPSEHSIWQYITIVLDRGVVSQLFRQAFGLAPLR